MSANFNFFVNRQGVQGLRGAKGDQGYSPVITVDTETANEYILKIQNEDSTFLTPNLRGQTISNTGGTYVRYDQSTESMYTGYLDAASTSTRGGVTLSTYAELEGGLVQDKVPSAMDVHDFVSSSISTALLDYVPLSTYNTKMGQLDASILDLETNKLDISDFNTYSSTVDASLSSLSTNKLDKSTYNAYVAATAITLNSLSTEKLDFASLSSTLIAGSNVTLSIDSVNKKVTINSAGGSFTQVQADWNEADDSDPSYIKNKPTLGTMAAESASDYTPTSDLATVATTGDYDDLLNKPTIPTDTSDLTNSAGYITSSALSGYQTTSNLVTSISSLSTDSQYPSAKLLYDTVGDIETILNDINSGNGGQP